MNFAVVIPVLNEELLLPNLLDDILSQDISPQEIVIGDCGSTDSTLDIIETKYTTVNVIKTDKKSPAAARNIAAKDITSDIIIFIDADIRLTKSFFKKLLKFHIDNEAVISYPKFRNDGQSFSGYLHLIIIRFWLWFWRHKKPDKGIGAVICVTKSYYEVMGGFDESQTMSEDVEFYIKASEMGFKINYSNNVNCLVSSRRVKGFGFFRVVKEDLIRPFFSKKTHRDYESYK